MSDIRRPAYLDRIVPFVDKPLIKVLTGMRRVGKSSLVRLLAGHLRDHWLALEQLYQMIDWLWWLVGQCATGWDLGTKWFFGYYL